MPWNSQNLELKHRSAYQWTVADAWKYVFISMLQYNNIVHQSNIIFVVVFHETQNQSPDSDKWSLMNTIYFLLSLNTNK
jgi:hypothetical protein